MPNITLQEILHQTGLKFVSEDVYYGPVFSSLYYEDKLISSTGKNENDVQNSTFMQRTYGKSQIVLKKELLKNATLALGDTFDAMPICYAWKDEVSNDRSDILFDLANEENIFNRILSCPKDSIPYVEAHFNFKIEKHHILKLLLSKSEIINAEEIAQTILSKFGIPVHIID